MILIFYITHKVISLHGENQIGSRNDITPDWSHGGTILIDAYAGGLVASKELDSKPLLLSNLRTTKMNDDVLAIARHHADVWCLTISNSGDFIVTGSHDRSIRHWDRTKEPISLGYAPKEELPEEGAMALAGKKTQETLTSTDLIIEALDIAEEELDRIAQHEALPFADALKLLSYLKDWASNPDKVILFALWNI
ncbi:hypothetical protein Pint_05401 [Pistacia integerrima]|uniref:Uncharacterized protein n=1 Tax=Pistacia integerrima TaxID=434235 RepID=A0ACC0Z5D9_9ROSI|nr:hypothetical protein Pint_05401 [Pistacia integerrima]